MQLARANSAPLAFAAALVLIGGLSPHALHAQTALPLVPDSAHVPQPPLAIPPITIRISVATASEDEGAIDPAARDIFEHLPAKYHSIHMIDERTIDGRCSASRRTSALPTGSGSAPDPGRGARRPAAPAARDAGAAQHEHAYVEQPRVLRRRRAHQGGTLVFKLVPEFSAYVEAPPSSAPQSPETPEGEQRAKRGACNPLRTGRAAALV